jgi:crotonobetainyl-CoA:carnitine CoA-transferase CaiB-like acyl-CoA transferase
MCGMAKSSAPKADPTLSADCSPDTAASRPSPAHAALTGLWHVAGLPAEPLAWANLPGTAAVLPSSFAVATAAQASLGAAALAAATLWQLRTGQAQRVTVDRVHAALECSGYFSLDGVVPALWDKLSGLYACGSDTAEPGWVRIHANFGHHRDGALRLLGLPEDAATTRDAVTQALRGWSAQAFEQAAADAGLVAAAARSFAQWDAHPQGLALAGQPVLRIKAVPPAAGQPPAKPRPWPDPGTTNPRPLDGLRVLDLTRILAGPVAGRCLAAYGADVMLVNGPQLPNIDNIADTSRGKLSALIDLRAPAGQAELQALLGSAHVFLQAYRPGALATLGWTAEALAAHRPGIVLASLSAYGQHQPAGPWDDLRGFDSLVQTATGFNLAEAEAAGSFQPQALPMQILDYAAGHLLALGIQAALWRQATLGGSWQVEVSLAGVGLWLRSLGRLDDGLAATKPDITPWLEDSACGFGRNGQARLRAVRHAAQLSLTPARWLRPSMPPGSHAPVWPPV